MTAKLSEVSYQPAQGFQEEGTWYAIEESIVADSDKELQTGTATLRHEQREYPVELTVLELEEADDERDEEDQEAEPVCTIEIHQAKGVSELASTLGLLDSRPPKKRRS